MPIVRAFQRQLKRTPRKPTTCGDDVFHDRVVKRCTRRCTMTQRSIPIALCSANSVALGASTGVHVCVGLNGNWDSGPNTGTCASQAPTGSASVEGDRCGLKMRIGASWLNGNACANHDVVFYTPFKAATVTGNTFACLIADNSFSLERPLFKRLCLFLIYVDFAEISSLAHDYYRFMQKSCLFLVL
jgi:hypothetical protein